MAKQQKSPCKYGAKCYRKNKQHFEEYSHPQDFENEEDEPEPEPPAKKKRVDKGGEPKKKTITDFFNPKGASKGDDKKEESTPGPSKKIEEEKSEGKEEKDKADEPESEEPESNNKSGDAAADAGDAPASPEDVKENIKQKFLLEMPEDFYAFWDFAKTLQPSNPNEAFKKSLGLELVGPFDILGGRHKKTKRKSPCYLRHWRYYYDPPELLTVVRGDDKTQFHMGYFRDDPQEMPAFVASNAAAENCLIAPRGENLFAAFNWFIDDSIKKNKSKKDSLSGLKEKLVAAAGDYCLDVKTKAMKARDKKVNCKLFHGAGLVVPVDENEVGYREIPETPGDLKKMFKKVVDAKTDKDRDAAFDPIMELIMLVQFANDECDYGEGLELGLDMFSYGGGDVFKSNILNLMSLAYQLLGRHEYKQVLEAHLEDRSHSAKLSQIE